jgi:hypothetical protein
MAHVESGELVRKGEFSIMPDVVIRIQNSVIANIHVFLLGLVWACAGGLGPAAMELWTDMTSYKDYGIDWKHVGYMAISGAAPLAIGYYQKHKALLALPPNVQEKLNEAAGVPQPNPTQENKS